MFHRIDVFANSFDCFAQSAHDRSIADPSFTRWIRFAQSGPVLGLWIDRYDLDRRIEDSLIFLAGYHTHRGVRCNLSSGDQDLPNADARIRSLLGLEDR